MLLIFHSMNPEIFEFGKGIIKLSQLYCSVKKKHHMCVDNPITMYVPEKSGIPPL